MAESHYILVVEQGPDAGRRLDIPPEGARLGRDGGNEFVLADPALSRFHCRISPREDGSLWVSDLGSTNDTLVNHKAIQEVRLEEGDRIDIGETTLRVTVRGARVDTPPPLSDASISETSIDLGLGSPSVARASAEDARDSKPSPASPVQRIIWGLVFFLAILFGAWVVLNSLREETQRPAAARPANSGPLEFTFEQVRGHTGTIYRYALELRERELTVQVHDLATGRHISRAKAVEGQVLARLRHDIESIPFFDLREIYSGLGGDRLDTSRFMVSLGRRTHTVRVENRRAPESFTALQELVEEFAGNELGLAALAKSPDELLALAREAYLLGTRLYEQREVRYQNLSRAIAAFEEAEWYLDTIEPKPDFHPTILEGREQASEVLQSTYQEQIFQAERAIKLRDWPEAARFLRVALELVPDRNDQRHEDARQKLLDVERRLDA